MGKTPVLICIDVEPDIFEIDRHKRLPWVGYEKCFELLNGFRIKAQELTGERVYFNWFYRLDPQVQEVYGFAEWVLRHYQKFTDELIAAGDGMGVHPHAWRWDESIARWYTDHDDPQWIRYCVDMSFNAYKRVVGADAQLFRFGERWMNTQTMNLARAYGAKFDLTLEPKQKRKRALREDQVTTGYLPNTMQIQRHPYQPDINNYQAESTNKDMDFWTLPIAFGERVLNAGRAEKLWRLITDYKSFKKTYFPMNPATLNARTFQPNFERLLEEKDACIVLPFRSDGAISAKNSKWLSENLEYLIKCCTRNDILFTKPSIALDILGLRKEEAFV